MAQKNSKNKAAENPKSEPIKPLGINFGNHPYFVKKAEEARKHIEKYGLPEDLLPKKK